MALLKKAANAHLVKLDKVRADTTVVPANVAYPSDAGLLAKGVVKLAKTVRLMKAMRPGSPHQVSESDPFGSSPQPRHRCLDQAKN